jgi:hypothetical protein
MFRANKRSYDDLQNENAQVSGKWTLEEEQFAWKLINDFELGLLSKFIMIFLLGFAYFLCFLSADCEEGCTLRSYLARKLNCAPMRISKKFAGQNIGKHTFIRKGLSSCSSPTSITSPHMNEERMNTMSIQSFPKFRKISRNHRVAAASSSSSIAYYHSPSPASDLFYDDNEDDCSVISTDSLLSDDSLSSHGSSSVETEAEEWKAVLQFYCGNTFTLKKHNKRTLSEGSELTTMTQVSSNESSVEALEAVDEETDAEDELALIFDL